MKFRIASLVSCSLLALGLSGCFKKNNEVKKQKDTMNVSKQVKALQDLEELPTIASLEDTAIENTLETLAV